MILNDSVVNCTIHNSDDNTHIHIKGNVNNPQNYKQMMLIAPNPIDRMTNYSGSGLPFPCSEIAFDNTPNKILIDASGVFSTTFKYPNSFYAQNGIDKIVSSVFFILYQNDNNVVHKRIELDDWCVLRTLTNRSARKNPEFYASKDYLLPIANAETVMREYAKKKIEYDIA